MSCHNNQNIEVDVRAPIDETNHKLWTSDLRPKIHRLMDLSDLLVEVTDAPTTHHAPLFQIPT